MISASIIDQGTINTTLPATSDPMYQVASLALFYKQQFAALRTAGFQFARPEVTDFTTFKNGLSTYLSDAYDRETEIIQDGVATTVATLPDILAIGSAFVSGGATEAGACILNIILGKLLGGDSGAHGDYENAQASPDMSEIVTKLEEITAAIELILTEFNINVFQDEESQTYSMGPLPE
jgi:predicted TIM-barrel enzyme